VPDRDTIARIVEQVFTARGIARRGSAVASVASAAHASMPVTPASVPSPPSPASAEKAPANLTVSVTPERAGLRPAPTAEVKAHPLPAPLEEVAEFLSENDVRMALTHNLKLYIGPKTILTPSARDLGGEHDIFVLTDIVPAVKKRRSES
jgi:hypothetical protein